MSAPAFGSDTLPTRRRTTAFVLVSLAVLALLVGLAVEKRGVQEKADEAVSQEEGVAVTASVIEVTNHGQHGVPLEVDVSDSDGLALGCLVICVDAYRGSWRRDQAWACSSATERLALRCSWRVRRSPTVRRQAWISCWSKAS